MTTSIVVIVLIGFIILGMYIKLDRYTLEVDNELEMAAEMFEMIDIRLSAIEDELGMEIPDENKVQVSAKNE